MYVPQVAPRPPETIPASCSNPHVSPLIAYEQHLHMITAIKSSQIALASLSWISRFYCLTNSYAPPMPHLCLTIALLNLPNNYIFVIYYTSPWVKLVSTNEMFYLL